MLHFSPSHLSSLAATATTAASYLDACDEGAQHIRLDPEYYRACGDLLSRIFGLVDAQAAFPELLQQSAAARETAEAVVIARRLVVSRLVFYPELAALLNRVEQ